MSVQAIPNGSGSSLSHTTPHHFSPWLFQNSEILSSSGSAESIQVNELVKKINRLVFKKGFVFLHLLQRTTTTQILVKAYPQACSGKELLSRLEPADAAVDLKNYDLTHLMIDDGLSAIVAEVSAISLDGYFLKLGLPETSRVKTLRKAKRYLCEDVNCKIIQGDFVASGKMIDFSTQATGINIAETTGTGNFNDEKPALLIAERGGTELYSGMARCICNRLNSFDSRLVLAPGFQQAALYPRQELRNTRQQAGHAFSACFHHPFSSSHIERDICDISLSGFSISNALEEDLLLPGMWIPELEIVYAGYVKMKCGAKVVYRRVDEEAGTVKYGLAIAGMSLEAYTRLSRIIWSSADARIGIFSDAEMDPLWEFLFDTGYFEHDEDENIGAHLDIFKESYLKLYRSGQDIARQIIYKTNGRIDAHVAMIRAYEPAWLVHHYAAKNLNDKPRFVSFLKDVIEYLGPYQRQHTAGANHFMTYYRPENDNISKFFNHFVRYINNSKKCSVDSFACVSLGKKFAKKLPEGWMVRECTLGDILKLKEFYEAASGGLLLDAMGINTLGESLKKSFAAAGFVREYRTYCLCCHNQQLAFFIVNRSDVSAGPAELLNGITVIIIEPDILSWAMLATVVNNLGIFYTQDTIPLMIYPSYFLPIQNIQMEKERALWILHTKAADDCLSYINRVANIRRTGQ
jgi:hypothetical protein